MKGSELGSPVDRLLGETMRWTCNPKRLTMSPFEHNVRTYQKGQLKVDRYWDALSDGGEPIRCGWTKDRFGLSW